MSNQINSQMNCHTSIQMNSQTNGQINTRTALFDSQADDYDTSFSDTRLGRYYRQRTHRVLRKQWKRDSWILELNAGTGEDALFLAGLGHHVLATDISTAMLTIIKEKVLRRQLGKQVSCQQLDLAQLDCLTDTTFDGILSNFGGLNCISGWHTFARHSYRLLRPGGIVAVCVMGPAVPWEWLWFLARGKPRMAFRRLAGSCEWHGSRIYYPRCSEFEAIMGSCSFQLLHREALGVFMPPPYTSSTTVNWQRRFRLLARLEESVCNTRLACRLADHYFLVFQKTAEAR